MGDGAQGQLSPSMGFASSSSAHKPLASPGEAGSLTPSAVGPFRRAAVQNELVQWCPAAGTGINLNERHNS